MSPDLRCFAKMTVKEEKIALLILKDYSNKQIANITNSSIPTVKAARRSLIEKYRASSLIHLVVLICLEKKYYDILMLNSKPQKRQFDHRELEVTFLLLRGRLNDEIATDLNMTVKSVEYQRQKFRQNLNIAGTADFVRKCIQYGILVIMPVYFRMRSVQFDNVRVKTYPLLKHSVDTKIDLDNLNTAGFIYFDYLNRFTYNFLTQEDSLRKIGACLTALRISDIPNRIIEEFFYSQQAISSSVLNSMSKVLCENDPLFLVRKEIDQGRLKLNINNNSIWPASYSLGQRYVFLEDLKGGPTDITLGRLNISKKDFERNVTLTRRIWGSHSNMGVLLTFLHLNYLNTSFLH
ncbi:MAG: LuxR C-terminal-related transcriptional regulator [bacterium]|nr:LuxR C-terminal-related transcriptional regulator [bacterium]